jgi:hypothetical protein
MLPGQSHTETWVVAAEHHAGEFKRLGSVLKALGYVLEAGTSTVAGSQEPTTWRAHSPDGSLSIEAETFVGLTVSGPSHLTARLKHRWTDARPSGYADGNANEIERVTRPLNCGIRQTR